MLYQGNKSDKNWQKDFSGIGRLYELDINIIGTSHRCKLLSDFFIKTKRATPTEQPLALMITKNLISY
jgi:hypothetical protein